MLFRLKYELELSHKELFEDLEKMLGHFFLSWTGRKGHLWNPRILRLVSLFVFTTASPPLHLAVT